MLWQLEFPPPPDTLTGNASSPVLPSPSHKFAQYSANLKVMITQTINARACVQGSATVWRASGLPSHLHTWRASWATLGHAPVAFPQRTSPGYLHPSLFARGHLQCKSARLSPTWESNLVEHAVFHGVSFCDYHRNNSKNTRESLQL